MKIITFLNFSTHKKKRLHQIWKKIFFRNKENITTRITVYMLFMRIIV